MNHHNLYTVYSQVRKAQEINMLILTVTNLFFQYFIHLILIDLTQETLDLCLNRVIASRVGRGVIEIVNSYISVVVLNINESIWHEIFHMFVIDNQSLEELEEEHSNEALSADDGGYYNISQVTMFIKTEELQRVISEKNTGEIKPFLSEYKVK